MAYRQILLALDLREQSENVGRRACAVANATGAQLTLLHRIEIGTIKSEIVRVANELGADLIVLGGYERHGLALLLGSTESSILNAAPCDVLAVRLNPLDN